ncbi:Major facilitator superfamily domain,Acetyl-coenzyme A transporter 1 [Cinara cedri]|uniref:Major facilitator superfamily domain,Acetyl-coenzyme A transporter 1 n=1 Tax=Cinara cedri TaxID=506608 RepID=A0A5E4M7L7_9HEMI|nr:Major facilitator superfamily domain,Acetyl-coenzyme A transporter 1 [Cinara cedri]
MASSKHEDEPEKTALTNNDSISDEEPNLKGDWPNIFLLLLLYTMQGLPLGLINAIPIIIQSNKNVSYKDQAFFSLVRWPYTLKILWAPFVDALYIHKIGRRKSWLIPLQFSMGGCFLIMANNIENWLPKTGRPNIEMLVSVFFVSKMLAATQDIVVDGWALTMLKKKNIGYSSTCGIIGSTFGIMMGSVFFVLITSEEFCNKYLRSISDTGGIMTIKSLLNICGVLFMVITTLIAVFKKEKDCMLEDDHVKLNTFQNYLLIWDILKLPSIRIFAIALFTSTVAFSVSEHLAKLKLVDAGISKDDMVVIETGLLFAKMIIPMVVAKFTSGLKLMNINLKAISIRLFWNIVYATLIYYTPTLITTNGVVNIPKYYFPILVTVLLVDTMLSHTMVIAYSAFFSRISDPRFGGTYMTLLNTILNLGYSLSASTVLIMADVLTFKKCSFDTIANNCSTLDLQNMCKTNGGDCAIIVNGYYMETAVCTVIGTVWYTIFKNVLQTLQTKSSSHWIVNVEKPAKEKNDKNVYALTIN